MFNAFSEISTNISSVKFLVDGHFSRFAVWFPVHFITLFRINLKFTFSLFVCFCLLFCFCFISFVFLFD